MALKEKLIDKAQKLIQKGYLDKAIVEYRAAADADPRDISIRLRIGDLYVKLGKNADAVKEYAEAARANAQRGFYLKAIAVYKQVLKLEENLETHNKLAELYVKQRLIADAIGEYSFIVTWFERRGKTSEVLETLKKMVEIDPDNIGVRLKLAELYQKLSFDKDSLSEYSLIFDKLVSSGKLDTAEKVYIQLFNANPAEERVLTGLAELYRLKGDNAQRLRFLKALFNHYSDSARMDEARKAAASILEIKPDDPHALRLLKKQETRQVEEFSAARSEPTEAVKEPVITAAPLTQWPEEEIEITIEGFEDAAVEGNVPAAASPVEEVPAASPADMVESADSGASESKPAEVPVISAPASGEIEIDIEDLLRGELPAIEEHAAPPLPEAEEIIVPEAHVEAAVDGPQETTSAVAAAEDKAATEEQAAAAGVEEARTEVAPAEPVEQVTPFIEAPIDDVLDVPERAEVIIETVEAVEHALETIEEVQALSAVPEPVIEIEPEERAAGAVEEARAETPPLEAASPVEVVEEARTEDVQIPEQTVSNPPGGEPQAALEDVQVPEPPQVQPEVEPEVIEAEVEPVEAEEELQEDLSSAIQELMEKMEPAEPWQQAAQPVEAAPVREEYVDLSVELGMEEASEDLAGPWGKNEPAETFDEFKTGIGKQLSKEDSETHYNLGIAYMEMELFGEAAKEFKIALKDSRLELDCYLRLGLCAMAEGSPEEAIVFYSKGLTAASSDEEKKGMMYELALAYEASGRADTAFDLFSGVFAIDPDFREAAAKVSIGALTRPLAPLNDGLIEVELL